MAKQRVNAAMILAMDEDKKPDFKANFPVDREKWDRFKKIAKLNNSDAAKELRKAVDTYLAENHQLALKIQD